ncbi:hypothetical protein Hamer_G003721 [Homarus americanus]|uniref:Uncharacterized protein n=1 Tax=Homarus americanus TaxID=6706 RepID=A0A8J5JYY3_HOMAM|nr:hypothetical protein Hamer_G003721 [Homarus americanus]
MGTLAQEVILESAEVDLEVVGAGMKRGRTILMPKVLIIQNFPTMLHNSVANTSDISRWTHLRGVELPELQSNSIEILIGQDVPQVLVPLEVRAGRDGMSFRHKNSTGLDSKWTGGAPRRTRSLHVRMPDDRNCRES